MSIWRAGLFLMTSALFTACGPGNIDGAYPIKNGYLFYETGGNGKTIRYEEQRGWSVMVVPERVDAYEVDGDQIVVARRPADVVVVDGVADWRLGALCEYWSIDTKSHAVRRIADVSKWPSVRCN